MRNVVVTSILMLCCLTSRKVLVMGGHPGPGHLLPVCYSRLCHVQRRLWPGSIHVLCLAVAMYRHHCQIRPGRRLFRGMESFGFFCSVLPLMGTLNGKPGAPDAFDIITFQVFVRHSLMNSFTNFGYLAIFQVSFFICITTIGLNIIFGIIVDTFSELRDLKVGRRVLKCEIKCPYMYLFLRKAVYVLLQISIKSCSGPQSLTCETLVSSAAEKATTSSIMHR